MAFEPIFNAFTTRPKPQGLLHDLGRFKILLKDNFSITTWLLFGAFLQGLAVLLLPYKNITLVAPVFGFLAFKLVNTLLIATGVRPDPMQQGVVPGRSVPVFANPKTGVQDDPAGNSVAAIILAARPFSSLGMFSPGFKETGDFFDAFIAEMNSDPTKYGYLGTSKWSSAEGDTSGVSENMGIVYFENEQKIHEFAHGESHTKALEWYYRNGGKDFKHIGLMHEIFAAPKRGWEGVYLNYKPTGLGATTREAQVNGQKVWINPLVKGKGKLNWSKGRLGIEHDVKEWNAYENVLHEEGKV